MNNRLNTAWVHSRLKEAGSWSKHALGQNFLIDESVLDAVVAAANLAPGETVIEIGPGLGVLTERLLEKGVTVICFEFDTTMIRVIHQDFTKEIIAGTLRLVEGDAIHTLPTVLATIPGEYKVVANIPYQITTPLINVLLEKGPRPTLLSLLMQKEVGERLAAGPGMSERSFLSVLTQYFSDVQVVRTVPPEAFYPAPSVNSAVVRIAVRKNRLLPDEQEQHFLRFVRMGFQQRRKQLKNVLAGVRGLSPAAMQDVLVKQGFKPNIRAQELSLEEWVKLFVMKI